MMYESTRTLLQRIVQSLAVTDDIAWDDQIESGRECLYEMHQMTRVLTLPDKTAYHRWAASIPDLGKLQKAIPHVKEMVAAIQQRDQPTALHTGKAALAKMNETSFSRTGLAIKRHRQPKQVPKPTALTPRR